MQIREVASPAARNQYFLSRAVGSLNDGYPPPALGGFRRAEQTRGTRAQYDWIEFSGHFGRERIAKANHASGQSRKRGVLPITFVKVSKTSPTRPNIPAR